MVRTPESPDKILPRFSEDDQAKEWLVIDLLIDMGLNSELDDDIRNAVLSYGIRQVDGHRQAHTPYSMGVMRVDIGTYVAALQKGEVIVPERKPTPHMDDEDLATPGLLDVWLVNKYGWLDDDDTEWDKLERKVCRRYFLSQVAYYKNRGQALTLGELDVAASHYMDGYEQCLCDVGLRVANGLDTLEANEYGGL